MDEAGHVLGVDVVAHLLALVAEDRVLAPFQVAFHQVAEETVQFDAGMVRAGQAAAAQAAGRHAEVAAVFLHHDVGRHLGGAEQGVLGLVDGERFRDAVGVGRVGVIPAGLQLLQRDGVGQVAIDLVGGHVNEGRLGAELPRSLQQVQRADGVGVEIVEGDRRRPVVGGLGGGVDDAVPVCSSLTRASTPWRSRMSSSW